MNRTMQRLHACSGKWLPKDSKQQLYAVAIVSCVLLILLQGRQLIESHLQSEPAAAGETTAQAAPSATNDAQTAAADLAPAAEPIVAAPAAEFDTDRNPPRSELLVVEQAADPVSQPDEEAQFTAAAPPDDSEIRDGAGTTAQPVSAARRH